MTGPMIFALLSAFAVLFILTTLTKDDDDES